MPLASRPWQRRDPVVPDSGQKRSSMMRMTWKIQMMGREVHTLIGRPSPCSPAHWYLVDRLDDLQFGCPKTTMSIPVGSSVSLAAPAGFGPWFLAVPAEFDSRIGRSGHEFASKAEMNSRIGQLGQDLASQAEIDSMFGIVGWVQMIPTSQLQTIPGG